MKIKKGLFKDIALGRITHYGRVHIAYKGSSRPLCAIYSGFRLKFAWFGDKTEVTCQKCKNIKTT